MSHLKIVRDEPPRPPRRKGERSPLLTREEAQRFRQAMKKLRDAFGTRGALAAAMDSPKASVEHMARGYTGISGDMIIRVMRASGLSLAELLGGPALAGTCRACGAVKKAS